MKTLALFDFDRTLYKKDSLLEFTKFTKGNTFFYKEMLQLFPDLIGLKLRLLNNEKVKIKYLTAFFSEMPTGEFEAVSRDFAIHQIEKDINPEIFKSFQKHLESGHEVVIVTASVADWITPWADRYGVRVIGTQLQSVNGRLTGNLASRNCYGIEKVNRIKEVLDLEIYQSIAVYGSGSGDIPMLGLARNP